MKLTILGSGSATPTISRNPTAQLLEASGRLFLIDCGEGTQLTLLRFKISPIKIDHIFISHLHGDHWLGLPGLISSMHLNGRKNPLHIYCSKGLDTILKSIFNFSDTQLHFELCFHFNNHNQKELLLENNTLKIFAFPLKHRIPCSGFLFQEKPKLRNIRTDALEIYQIPVADLYGLKQGKDWKSPEGNVVPNHLLTNNPKPSKSFAFCSDTIFDLDLVQYISGVDLLYHEATFLQILKSRATETFHTTASEAGILAAKAKVKKLLIGHYSSRYKETHSFLDEAKAEFSETILAFDGLQLEV